MNYQVEYKLLKTENGYSGLLMAFDQLEEESPTFEKQLKSNLLALVGVNGAGR